MNKYNCKNKTQIFAFVGIVAEFLKVYASSCVETKEQCLHCVCGKVFSSDLPTIWLNIIQIYMCTEHFRPFQQKQQQDTHSNFQCIKLVAYKNIINQLSSLVDGATAA